MICNKVRVKVQIICNEVNLNIAKISIGVCLKIYLIGTSEKLN